MFYLSSSKKKPKSVPLPFRKAVKLWQDGSWVDSPELPETPEITEMTANFMKVTIYLTKFKETLINYVWEKSNVKKH